VVSNRETKSRDGVFIDFDFIFLIFFAALNSIDVS